MRISVINLERSVERRQQMHARLTALGLAHEFFAAIDAARGQLEGVSRYDEARALRVLGQPLTPAEVGTFASHYLLWQQCARDGAARIVMEDDLQVDPAFVDVVTAVSGGPLQRLGFVRLHGLSARQGRLQVPLSGGYRLVRYAKGPRGAQCYAISPEGAAALVRGASVWVDAVDLYLDAFWLHGLASHAIEPYRVHHLDESMAPSTIGSARHAYRRTPREKLRRELTHMLWSLKRYWFNLRYRAPQISGL